MSATSATSPSPAAMPARMATRKVDWLNLVVAVLLMGAGWPLTRFAVTEGAPTLWLLFGRIGLSCLVCAAAMLALGRLRWPGRADWPALLTLGLLQITGFFTLGYIAVAWIPAGRTAILSCATTLWVVPLSVLLLREAIPPRRWLAALLGLGGVMVMSSPWSIDWSSPAVLLGHALLLGAALCWAGAIVVLRRFPPGRPMLELLPWCFGLATLLTLPLALTQPLGQWNARALSALAFLGVVVGPVALWCSAQVQMRMPAVVSSIGLLLSPAAGLVLSTLWLGEALGLDLAIGTGIILGGAIIAAWPRKAA
ncbi:DMT family transporter [Pseudoroseomonas wenyumeiae]|uniref:DMT family transporter n=1 Tax=Teichococcus wenyumeiae TaxID=2478470 RepID=A0A3A9JEX6_9PROT|nr:DMT family transporter [Pseudoroseomonas wenyumeiae]RKK02176.1 DMT family transporter [Pseudoroseomonas wenyumeiae]RMI26321.1 DMT family transporter [Pseudoroseomonas wenyumeiae]